jgi:hypothetical protein
MFFNVTAPVKFTGSNLKFGCGSVGGRGIKDSITSASYKNDSSFAAVFQVGLTIAS